MTAWVADAPAPDTEPHRDTYETGAKATGSRREEEPVTGGSVDRETNHWAGAIAIALVMAGVGVLVSEPALLVAAGVGVVFVAYARSGGAPQLRTDGESVLLVERGLSDATPAPGEEVTVTVTVTNAGNAHLPDLRLVDGVSVALSVVDGSPRHGAVLRPGARTSFRYTVRARRGEHEWNPLRAVAANASASVERETAIPAETTMHCTPRLLSSGLLPLRAPSGRYAGQLRTDEGGDGIEFYATREYRRGDPLRRIDWHRLARSGELATLELAEERLATVVLLLDARRSAYRAPATDERHAVERSVDAARRVFGALDADGHRVGIAVFAPKDAWLPPQTGPAHRADVRSFLSTHPALSPIPPDYDRYETMHPDRRRELREQRIERLRRRLPTDAQVLLFSPCCDDYAGDVARGLEVRGHPVTIVSPDPTATTSPGQRVARIQRDRRLDALRRAGIRVIDWPGDEPFEAACARARTRWSA